MDELLILVDRDGTLIEFVDYLGREDNWKEQIRLNIPVIKILKFIQENDSARIYVISNQQGVARRYFDCRIVDEINNYINKILAKDGIRLHGWDYCPDVDQNYVAAHNEIDFDQAHVKEKTKRKPSIDMVIELLKKDGLALESFRKAIVFGDAEDDKKLAENLRGNYIDVKGKDYKQLKEEFLSLVSGNR